MCERMLHEIKTVPIEILKRGLTLSDARHAIHALTDAVDEERENKLSTFYGWKLSNNYINNRSTSGNDSEFESGVVKIQRGEECTMTSPEKLACKSLLLSVDPVARSESNLHLSAVD